MNPSVSSILRGGLIGAAAGAAINAIVFFIAKALGTLPENVLVGNSGQPIMLVPVVIASIVPAVISTLLFWALARFTKSPKKIFIGVAVVVFIATLGGPFSIPNVPSAMIVTLEVMHLVAALAITFGLVTSYVPTPSPQQS
jgi:hypothetical protein